MVLDDMALEGGAVFVFAFFFIGLAATLGAAAIAPEAM